MTTQNRQKSNAKNIYIKKTKDTVVYKHGVNCLMPKIAPTTPPFYTKASAYKVWFERTICKDYTPLLTRP